MTVVQWIDGNVLTAGSLRLIPQFYSNKTNQTTAWISGTSITWNNVGSEFISGGIFAEKKPRSHARKNEARKNSGPKKMSRTYFLLTY